MKKMTMLIAVLATFVIASCGGSSDTTPTTTPTPTITTTNDSTKAVSKATIAATNEASFGAAQAGLDGLAPIASVSQSDTDKESFSANINHIYECTVSGNVLATGTMTGQCTDLGNGWSCTGMLMNIALQFNGCTETVTVDGTEYTETLNGTGSSSISGSVSGTDTGPTNIDLIGTGTATLDATGDATGIVTLDLGLVVSGPADPEPTVTCSGTASVVTDAVTEVCGITSDCSGCEA